MTRPIGLAVASSPLLLTGGAGTQDDPVQWRFHARGVGDTVYTSGPVHEATCWVPVEPDRLPVGFKAFADPVSPSYVSVLDAAVATGPDSRFENGVAGTID